jgi:post-segregation antitoxin (ccd killing protein)
MATKLDDLLAEALRLPPTDRKRLLELLEAVQVAEANAVRDGGATYQSDPMTLVTVALPDDLAQQAQDAGLLAGRALEEMLRRELQAQDAGNPNTQVKYRQLVEKNGRLVAEALPGEKPISTEEVKKILDDMEW